MKKVLFTCFLFFLVLPIFADIEVVVTASRMEEDPDTTPASVYVLTAEDLEASSSILDVLGRVPGIQLRSTSGTESSAYLSMGGFGENGFGRVLILVDGISVNRPDMNSFNWLSVPLQNIEKVEILQGAASSLYGDSAVAGVLNIITSSVHSSDKFSVEGTASIDSNLANTESLSVSYGNNLIEGRLYGSRTNDLTSRERTEGSMWSAGGSLGLNPLEGLHLVLSGAYTPSEYQMPGGLTLDQYQNDPDQAVNQEDQAGNVSWNIQFNPQYKASSFSLSSPVSFSRVNAASDMVSWFSYVDTKLDNLNINPQGSLNLPIGSSILSTTSLGSDIRLSSMSVQRYATAERTASSFEASISRSSFSLWLRDKINLSEFLIVDGGIRYEIEEVSADFDNDTLDGSAEATPFVFDAGISFLPSEDWKISLRGGSVFRYPFLDEQVVYYGYGSDMIYTDIDPERGYNITLSADYSSEWVEISLVPYLLLMSDEIVYDSAQFRNVNSEDDTLHYGTALSIAHSNQFFTISGSYSLNRAIYSEGELEGNVIPLVSLHMADGTISLPLPADLIVTTTLEYNSGYYMGGDTTNSEEMISGRFGWDACIVWTPSFIEDLRISAAAKNILDDRTPTTAYFNSYSSSVSYYPMAGRVFELSVSWAY